MRPAVCPRCGNDRARAFSSFWGADQDLLKHVYVMFQCDGCGEIFWEQS